MRALIEHLAIMLGFLGAGFSRMGANPGASSGGGAPAYSPSLDFSDARNSQYLPLL